MTDHLEPYRRMARSIRFFPPSALAKPIPQPVIAASVVDSWVKKTSSNADVKSIEPPIDLSEHVAALVHEAVWKPTVLPATYVIPENIGDRISRLAASSSVDSVKIQANIAPATLNGTTVHHSETFEINSDRLVYDPQRQVYALESTVVAEAMEVEETIPEAPVAVVAEAMEVEETIPEVPVAVVAEAMEVEETIPEVPVAVEETVAEVESDQPPTFLEKVSSVIDAVSTAFMNPELVRKENEAVVEPASPTPEAIATPVTDTEELLTTEAPEAKVEPAPPPSLLERVSAVVEVVTTTLKNPEAIAFSTPAAPKTASDIKPIAVACPACGSIELRKNGRRQGKQRYACKDCGRQFAMAETLTAEEQPQAPEAPTLTEEQPKPQEISTVEASTSTNSQIDVDTDLSDAANSAKAGSKKKKAKGFGAFKKNK